MIITLIGYRGTGKSTIGVELAARLGWAIADSDTEIERRAGTSIAQIFSMHGEFWFRQLERDVLAELLGRDRLIVAAGGGAILDETTRALMKRAGPVVWLQGSVETLLARMALDPRTQQSRPALTEHADPAEEVRHLLSLREPLYAETASIIVSTDAKSVSVIVDEIVSQLSPDEGEG